MRALYIFFFTGLIEAKGLNKRLPETVKDPAFMRKVDEYPEPFPMPVPFGHIYKEGFGDTSLGHKAPIDLLELTMRLPKSFEEAKSLLENADPSRLHIYRDSPIRQGRQKFVSPRHKLATELGIRQTSSAQNETLKWFDLTDLHARNLANAPVPRIRQMDYDRTIQAQPPLKIDPINTIGDLKFQELYNPPKKMKFTTCDEFGARAYFYPNDIINLEWIPFYVWSTDSVAVSIPHKFTYATKAFVKTYRELYHQAKDIDWSKPKLMMKGRGEFLLVAADRRGLFHAIPILRLPDNFEKLNATLPRTTIRMKIDDPYLALMFCEQEYAILMAIEANVPPTEKEKQTEADSIGFRGLGLPVDSRSKELKKIQERLQNIDKQREKRMSSPKPDYMLPQTPLSISDVRGGFA